MFVVPGPGRFRGRDACGHAFFGDQQDLEMLADSGRHYRHARCQSTNATRVSASGSQGSRGRVGLDRRWSRFGSTEVSPRIPRWDGSSIRLPSGHERSNGPGGTRTHMPRGAADFKSAASANSATGPRETLPQSENQLAAKESTTGLARGAAGGSYPPHLEDGWGAAEGVSPFSRGVHRIRSAWRS